MRRYFGFNPYFVNGIFYPVKRVLVKVKSKSGRVVRRR
jgi:hypothetical protein